MLMFIYICQAPPHLQFTKKINNWNSEKFYLVVCDCLQVVCGRLLVVWDHLCSFVVVCVRLCSLLVLVTTLHILCFNLT